MKFLYDMKNIIMENINNLESILLHHLNQSQIISFKNNFKNRLQFKKNEKWNIE